MRIRGGVWIACFVMPLFCGSCSWERPAPPAEQITLPPASGITLEQSKMDYRTVTAPGPGYAPAGAGYAGSSFREWYDSKGKPKMTFLFNRAYATDDAQFRADSRTVLRYNEAGSAEKFIGGSSREERFYDRSGETVAQREFRQNRPATLTNLELMQLQEAFIRPFQLQGVRIVDAEAATRLQSLSDSTTRQPAQRKTFQNTQTAAFAGESDLICELLVTRHVVADPIRFSISAKIVGAKTGGLVLYRVSDSVLGPTSIPGAKSAPPISLDRAAGRLAAAVMAELPYAMP